MIDSVRALRRRVSELGFYKGESMGGKGQLFLEFYLFAASLWLLSPASQA